MLIPGFTLQLKHETRKGLVTVGEFDGKHPSLAFATSANRVVIHSPHSALPGEDPIRFLNINQEITALGAGCLGPIPRRGGGGEDGEGAAVAQLEGPETQHRQEELPENRDVLLVGMPVHLMSYDVEGNASVFYRDVPEGVSAIVVGVVGTVHDRALAVVGGDCSVSGFDSVGSERFWTTTGDRVTALALCDVDFDRRSELLVGSEDFEIRIYQNEEVVSECSESETIVALTAITGTRYGYALADGTIGVYNGPKREWRVKSKHRVTALGGFDLDADGVPELVSGWDNGRVEVRADTTGDVVYKDMMDSPVTGIVKADYRQDGRQEIIVLGQRGEVRGYHSASGELKGNLMGVVGDEEALHELHERKQELQQELHGLEENIKHGKKKGGDVAGLVPVTTRVACDLECSEDTVDLVLETNNESLITVVTVTADHIFETESLIIHPTSPQRRCRVAMKPLRDEEVQLKIVVLVGVRGGEYLHTFEITHCLPKFACYVRTQETVNPSSKVSFRLNERVGRVARWLKDNFLSDMDDLQNASYVVVVAEKKKENRSLDVSFRCQRDPACNLRIVAKPEEEDPSSLMCTFMTDNIALAGELVQGLCAVLKVPELESLGEFPQEMETMREMLSKADHFHAVRRKLTAEMADTSHLVKAVIIKAEDSRMLNDLKGMRGAYLQAFDVNRDLLSEYSKRSNNHKELLSSLKRVNQIIQLASKLRMGRAKLRVVAQSRAAVKKNNVEDLLTVLRTGSRA